MLRTLCILGLTAFLLGAPLAAAESGAERGVVVFLVRHAEKDADGSRDPGLSAAGLDRATALAEKLAHAGVTHLYATQYRRTRQTLAPLGRRSGHDVEVIEAQDAQAQLRALRDLPAGSLAVVAGHSNTIPALVCDLGGRSEDLDCSEAGAKFDESEYDRLYLVILPPPGTSDRSPWRTLSLRYGD